MINFWKMINIRWDEESIKPWSSIKKTIYILLPLLVYYLVHDMAEILLWGALNLLAGCVGDAGLAFLKANSYTVRGMISGLAILCGVAVISPGVAAEIHAGGSEEGTGMAKRAVSGKDRQRVNEKRVTAYMVLGALSFLSALGLNLLFDLIGFTESSVSFTQTATAQFGVEFGVGLVLYGILSPLAEEAVFRGLIYNRMKRCFSYLIAVVVSSLLFGCYHGNLVQAVYGTILGIFIAYSYEKYESFAAPVLFHAVANVSIFVMTYGNKLAQIDRTIRIVMAIVSLLGAAGCLIWITKKNCVKNKDKL